MSKAFARIAHLVANNVLEQHLLNASNVVYLAAQHSKHDS